MGRLNVVYVCYVIQAIEQERRAKGYNQLYLDFKMVYNQS